MDESLKQEMVQAMLRLRSLHINLHRAEGRDKSRRFSRGRNAARDTPACCAAAGEQAIGDPASRCGAPPVKSARKHDLNIRAVVILHIIEHQSQSGKHLDFSAIAQQQLHISKPAVSLQLKTLERKGLIERRVNPHDLRRFDFRLTEAGRQATAEMRQGMDEHLEWIAQQMGEGDLRELLRLFNKFADILNAFGGRELLDPPGDLEQRHLSDHISDHFNVFRQEAHRA